MDNVNEFDWHQLKYGSNFTVVSFGYRGGLIKGPKVSLSRYHPDVKALESWLAEKSGTRKDNHCAYEYKSEDGTVLYFWFSDFSMWIGTQFEHQKGY